MCPAPRWGGTGETSHRGQAVPVAGSDRLGPPTSCSVRFLAQRRVVASSDRNGGVTLAGSEGESSATARTEFQHHRCGTLQQSRQATSHLHSGTPVCGTQLPNTPFSLQRHQLLLAAHCQGVTSGAREEGHLASGPAGIVVAALRARCRNRGRSFARLASVSPMAGYAAPLPCGGRHGLVIIRPPAPGTCIRSNRASSFVIRPELSVGPKALWARPIRRDIVLGPTREVAR
jgi:hypothetical protein